MYNHTANAENAGAAAKAQAYDLLGGICTRCGFTDIRALQIDHVEGGGQHEARGNGRFFYRRVIRSVLNNERRFQLLCANCNWIKRAENREFLQPRPDPDRMERRRTQRRNYMREYMRRKAARKRAIIEPPH